MATAREQLAQFAAGSKALGRLCREYKNRSATVHLEELVGGALSFYAAAAVAESGGVHVFVAEDRDAAAYLLNDFYNLLDERQVYFFPSSWKRSAAYGAEDAQGVVQRTATMHAVRNFTGKGYLVVCTCPEALAERVADAEALQRETITVRVGDRISIEVLEQALVDASFTCVDFVYEPGQYSVRGGIVDVFSYSESKPYRLDFFGDEVDSIRRFNISSQLSSDRLERVEIIPDLNAGTPAAAKVSFARFAGAEASWWFYDADFVLRRVNDIRRRTLSDMEHPDEIDSLLTSRNSLVADLSGSRIFLLRDNLPERPAAATVKFATSPQPKFNKNFEMLADDMIRGALRGYDTYILSENKAQVERLENIFHQIGRGQAVVRSLSTTLHEGFVDNDLKLCLYTDHQIFDRYQRYRINGEIRRDEQMTVAELNQLRPGDYVVHIDHGVGRFDGLVKIAAGDGRMQEAIKLVYKDGDVLFVNVHSLHRISRYKSGDGEPPKVYKLGNGAWQKLKNATKKAVKDISRELIALYAKRKASKGYAFSHDSYLQHELEASFRWEDTPDQQSATAAIKKDMESDQPMDRLVCGDVGFGKTEVAIRAAFKAAVDGKQVAVLVPTTILALQHYRSFTERLRDFPVRVEYINRTKSTKEVSQIREDLASGKIDILIGTHKMLGKQIVFRDLGLLIIDEEQKFGVAAKEKLTEMSVSVDTLTLTATPIPRTLQFSLMGSRDLSVISTPPPNRQPILTESHVFSEEIIRDAVEAELARGGQVYFVHNRVEDLPALQGLITGLRARQDAGRAAGETHHGLHLRGIRRAGVDDHRRERHRHSQRQYDHRRQRPELRFERPAPAARPRGAFEPEGLLLPAFAARRTAVVRRAAASAGHRGVFRPGFGVQHRHAGPRHSRRGQPAGRRAERVHRRHRFRDLPEDYERGGGRTACRGASCPGPERRGAGGRGADAFHRRRAHRHRGRGRAARRLRFAAGRTPETLPRTRLDEGRGGFAGLREPSCGPLRSPAARREGAVERRAPALGGHSSGHGAREGQERADDRAFRGRGELAFLQERGLYDPVAAGYAAARPICAQTAQ